MAKYTKDTVQAIPDSDIAKELLAAQQENIATGNPDVQLITDEIGRRIAEASNLRIENSKLKITLKKLENSSETTGSDGHY